MSKITFRADEDLIKQIEEFDASKSEIMREALRAYLDDHVTPSQESSSREQTTAESTGQDSLDALVAERVDELIADRLGGAFARQQPQDLNVNITLDGGFADQSDPGQTAVNTKTSASHDTSNESSHESKEGKTVQQTGENADPDERKTCTQCGEELSPSHVYCPNCGEKSARRVFCECGDEIRSDWSFCPGCGRRTAAADVLDQS